MYFPSIVQFYAWIFVKILSNSCGFRKGHSMQYCLLPRLGKWESAVDKVKSFISFDCLSHEPLFARLHVYGFSVVALRLIHSYLPNIKQRTKVNLSYSLWENVLFGVPQWSILGSLLFNIFLCDLFFIVSKAVRH